MNYIESFFSMIDFFFVWFILSGFFLVESEVGGIFYNFRGFLKEQCRNEKEKEKKECIDQFDINYLEKFVVWIVIYKVFENGS